MRLHPIILALPLAFLAACNAAHESPEFLATADSTGFSNDVSDMTSGSRKIVRQADMDCRVQDVMRATTTIEQQVRTIGGFISESRVEQQTYTAKTLNYKPDSLRLVRTVSPTAHLTLRIPSAYLDSALSSIASVSSFIEHRSLSQQDQTYLYLSNALKNEAVTKATAGSKAFDSTAKAETVIDRRLQNLQVLDDVNYATLTLQLTQPEQVYVETVVNPDYVQRLPFFTELGNALRNGGLALRALILGLAASWPLWVILAGIAAYFFKRKKRIRITHAA